MIQAFPKIFALGSNYISDIFKEEVEISEKVDGSQFSFGKINGELFMRSKGAQLFIDNPEKMFSKAISYVQSIQHRIPDGVVFYCEYLNKPKHNTLVYSRVPKNNLMLFAVMGASTQLFNTGLDFYAELLEIEAVTVIYRGKVENSLEITELLNRESALGGVKIEGVVVKNFYRPFLLGGTPIPLMAGKFVSEEFKEVHRDRWGAEEQGKSRLTIFFDSFRSESRWRKAVQHLQEVGKLSNSPADIGNLLAEISRDIEEEEIENIKSFLWKEFSQELKRKATAGFPEYYKKMLLENSFTK